MAFDPISWALGFALTRAGTWALNQRKDLRDKLRKAVADWVSGLPPELDVEPDAIFPQASRVNDDDLDALPALKELRELLSRGRVPPTVAWENAIAERTRIIRQTASLDQLQPFFSAPGELEHQHINTLAEKLYRICSEDEKLSRSTTVEDVGSLNTKVDQLLEAFAANQADRGMLDDLPRRPATHIVGEAGKNAVPTLGISDFVFAEWQADRSRELDDIREDFRRGVVNQAYTKLRHFYESPGWERLSPKVRSLALRLAASMELDRAGDVEAARKWLRDARTADPRGNFQVIEALIANWEHGPAAALDALGRPETVDAWNISLILRLAQGDAEAVLAELNAKTFEVNAESSRIRALALLAQKKIEEAESCARESESHHPEWAAMRNTLAIVQYANTISPEFHAWGHLTWPVPSPWSFVRTDDEAVRKLRAAATAFERLLAETPIGARDKADLETWKLATLANDPDRQDDAKQFVAALLAADSSHYRAAIWAMERGFPFNRTRVKTALVAFALTPGAELDAIIAAVALAEIDFDHATARDLLERSRQRFREVDAESVWRLLFAQVLVLQGEAPAATAVIAEEPDARLRLKCEAAVEKLAARETKDFQRVADALVGAYEAAASAETLFEAAEACMYSDRPGWVLDHANELLEAFNTTGAVRLVLQAGWAAGRPDLCFGWLNTQQHVFPGRRLPNDLRRLEIACLRRLGRLTDAHESAAKLVATSPDPQNLLELFQTQFVSGDLVGCVGTARLVLTAQGVSPLHLLEAARVVSSFDNDLAVELWTAATSSSALDDDSVLVAVDVAYRLGLGERIGALMQRVHRIASSGHGAIRAAPIDEIIAIMQRQRETREEANRNYNAGVGPVHMISAIAGWPLAAIYHTQLSANANAETALRQAPVMIRHGRRQANDKDLQVARGSLVADITSIMLADELGILDAVEEHLGPLYISAWLPRSLEAQLSKSEAHDAASDSARSTVVGLINTGRIAVMATPWPLLERTDVTGRQMGALWCAWLERVKTRGGVLVDFYPLLSNDGQRQIVALQQPEAADVVSTGGVIAALRARAVISDPEMTKANAMLGAEAHANGPAVDLPPGREVFLEQGIAEQFARAGVLDRLCDHCRVEISESSDFLLKSDAAAARSRADLVKWLRRLLERLYRGMSARRYVTFTNPLAEEQATLEENVDFRCLHDLIPAAGDRRRIVWTDDRFMNGHLNTEAGPVISTFEMLGSLRKAQHLSDRDYFTKLLDLRKMGARYLSLTSEEILYHLERATIHGERLEETAELATLRMSLAAAVRDKGRLQIPPPNVFSLEHPGEFQWLMDIREAVAAAIQECWRRADTKTAFARSSWLLNSLHFDMGAFIDLFASGAQVETPVRPFIADALRFFLAGTSLPTVTSDSPHSTRRIFYRWLYFRIIAPMVRANPGAAPEIGTEVSQVFDSYAAAAGGVNRNIAAAMALLYQDIPAAMREIVPVPTIIRQYFGEPGGELGVSVAGFAFPFTEFWRAASEAVGGREASLRTFDGMDCTAIPGITNELGRGASIRVSSGRDDLPITSEFLPLLSNNIDTRRQFLERHNDFFDLPRLQRVDTVSSIASVDDPAERIELIRNSCQLSMPYFYRELSERFRSGSRLNPEDLFPGTWDALPRFLRLEPSHAVDWNVAAQQLVEDEGIEEAILRMGCVPILLPAGLLTRARVLPVADFEELLNRISRLAPIALSNLQSFHLISNRSAVDAELLDRAVSLRNDLVSTVVEAQILSTFILVLRCIFEQIRQATATTSWHPSVTLACTWAHARCIYAAAIESGISSDQLAANLQEVLLKSSALLDVDRVELLDDVVHPLRIEWPAYLFRAVAGILWTLPAELTQNLRLSSDALTSLIGDADAREVVLSLAAETDTRANALGSFLGGAWSKPFDLLLPPDFRSAVFDVAPRESLIQCLTAIECDLTDWDGWAMLWALIGDAPFYSDQRDRISALIRSGQLVQLLRVGGAKALPALLFLCAQARYESDETAAANLEKQLLACAEHCQTLHEERKDFGAHTADFDTVSWKLLEAAFLLSCRLAGTSAVAPFHSLATNLIAVCPSFGTIWRKKLGGRVPAVPFSLARGTWPFYFALRSAK